MTEKCANNFLCDYATMQSTEREKWAKVLAKPTKPAPKRKTKKNLIERFFAARKEKPLKRLINGDDLIRILKLKPSKIFAQILRDVEEAQATGQITTKQDALDLAKKMASL